MYNAIYETFVLIEPLKQVDLDSAVSNFLENIVPSWCWTNPVADLVIVYYGFKENARAWI
jgi:hypothetical protein